MTQALGFLSNILTALIGIFLTIAPNLFGFEQTLIGILDGILGPSLVVFATLSMRETLFGLRWVSVMIGILILIAPIWIELQHPGASQASFITSTPTGAAVNLIVGFLSVGLSLLGRERRRNYGGGWSILWRRDLGPNQIQWT